jgi:hypothetical protein
MTTTYVAFDTRSGRILSVHHGAIDDEDARQCAQHRRQPGAKIDHEHLEVIPIPLDAVEREKLYKVDIGRKVLVVASAQNGGVGFGVGETANALSKRPEPPQ